MADKLDTQDSVNQVKEKNSVQTTIDPECKAV